MAAFERTNWNDDPKEKPERLRVSADFERDGLIEVVDAWMTSRNPTAQETEVFCKLILTREMAAWLRDTLTACLAEATAPSAWNRPLRFGEEMGPSSDRKRDSTPP